MGAQVAIQPVQQSVPVVKRVRCSFSNCFKVFPVEKGFVPQLPFLYMAIRGSKVDPEAPLAEDEVLRHVRCQDHAWGGSAKEFNQRHGIQMYPAPATLKVMETWMAKKVRREQQERELQERREYLNRAAKISRMKVFGERLFGGKEPPREKSYIDYHKPVAKPFVVETFGKLARPVEDKPRPKHRDHCAERQHFALRKKREEVKETAEAPQGKKRGKKEGKRRKK